MLLMLNYPTHLVMVWIWFKDTPKAERTHKLLFKYFTKKAFLSLEAAVEKMFQLLLTNIFSRLQSYFSRGKRLSRCMFKSMALFMVNNVSH